MNRPFLLIALFFCAGIAAANFIPIGFGSLFLAAAIVFPAGILLIKRRKAFAAMVLLLALLAGALAYKNSLALAKSHILNLLYFKNKDFYTVGGAVASLPQMKPDKSSFFLAARQIHFGSSHYRCSGKLLVEVEGRKDFYYGQSLLLKGAITPLPGTKYFQYLKREGVFCIMRVPSPAMVSSPGPERSFSVRRFAFWLKAQTERILNRQLSAVPASVLEAMILGEKKHIPKAIYDGMVLTGTVHILVVSGFNVGIVVFILALILKLARIPRSMRFVIAIPCLVLYCLLTGASNPVVRATVMGIFFLCGRLIRKEPDIYNALSLAALFILLLDPRQLFDIGFQLSFASVLAIVFLYPKLKAVLKVESLKIMPLRFAAEGCLVSFSAWLGTMGIIACYFKCFSPVTVLANLFIVPLAGLITLCGFSLVFISLLAPALAPFFASTSEFAVTVLVKLNLFLSQLPFASFSL